MKTNIIIEELLSTQALIIPIKVLVLLKFLLNNSQISALKLVFVTATFFLEIPSGYLADIYGNKKVVIFSKLALIFSFILFIFSYNFMGFIVANIFLGIANAFESGAKNTYFLELQNKYNFDYISIKIFIQKYGKIINFIFMLLSGFLYEKNYIMPFIITIFFQVISLFIFLFLPTVHLNKDNDSQKFSKKNKEIILRILNDKKLITEILFFTINTSILISNFDYYTIFFEKINISKSIFGIIFSSFMLINMLGIHLYGKNLNSSKEIYILLLVPFSFLFINTGNVLGISLGIFIQQFTFAYFSIHFDIYVIKNIKKLDDSSHYQSIVSFISMSLRIGILALIYLLLRFFSLKSLYFIFFIILLLSLVIYNNIKKKLIHEVIDGYNIQ